MIMKQALKKSLYNLFILEILVSTYYQIGSGTVLCSPAKLKKVSEWKHLFIQMMFVIHKKNRYILFLVHIDAFMIDAIPIVTVKDWGQWTFVYPQIREYS